jgi:hypothetical protein
MLVVIKREYSEVWKRVLEWFPLAEAAVFRWERMRQ